MRIIFAGTPEFAAPALRTLLQSSHEVVAVYTQPDRPAGRGRKLKASPVKELALEHNIPVYQPKSLKPDEVQQELASFEPDLMVVVAYGLILPAAVLETPKCGCVNVHASLLPRWRGAAPIQRAILAGDNETGVTLMQMDAGLDTGPMLIDDRCLITDDDTAGILHDRLASIGADLLGRHLDNILEGQLTPVSQDDAMATYAEKLEKREASLDWSKPANVLLRQVNAFNPWPVAQTRHQDQPLRIWRAQQADGSEDTEKPGCITRFGKDGVDVACGDGVLRLLEVQLPGGRRISGSDFANARQLNGVCFESDTGNE